MPAHSALASTSAAGRSPLASSARSKATAVSIFFGLAASSWPNDLGALRGGWWIPWGEADLASLAGEIAPAVFCRKVLRSGSKLAGLETELGRPTVTASLRPGLLFGSSEPSVSLPLSV